MPTCPVCAAARRTSGLHDALWEARELPSSLSPYLLESPCGEFATQCHDLTRRINSLRTSLRTFKGAVTAPDAVFTICQCQQVLHFMWVIRLLTCTINCCQTRWSQELVIGGHCRTGAHADAALDAALEATEPRQVVWEFNRFRLYRCLEVINTERQKRLRGSSDRQMRSRHALEKARHIHNQIADNWKVAQRVQAQWTVSIPHISHTGNTGKLLDAVNPQSARSAGGMVAGAAKGNAMIVRPCDVNSIEHVGGVGDLHCNCVVMRRLTCLVTKDLQWNFEHIMDLTDRTSDTRRAVLHVCDTRPQCQAYYRLY